MCSYQTPVFILKNGTKKIILTQSVQKTTPFIHFHNSKKTSCITDRENMREHGFEVVSFIGFVVVSSKLMKAIKIYLHCDFYATFNCITKGK